MSGKSEPAARPGFGAWVRWIASFYRPYLHVVAILLVLTPIQSALQALVPRLVGFTIDYQKTGAPSGNRFEQVLVDMGARFGLTPGASIAAAFFAIGLAGFFLYAYFQSWRAWMNVRLEWAFRQDAFNRITSKGPDFFNRFRTGDLVTRMTDDVAQKLSWFACSGIFRLYEALLSITFIVIMMHGIDPELTLWTAGPLPLLIVVFFRSASALDKRYDSLQKHISRVNDLVEACFSGIRVVKAYVREGNQRARFGEVAERRRKAEIKSVRATTVIDSLYNYIWQFGVVIVLVAGGYKVIHGNLSIGNLAAFIYYVTWLVFPMFDVGQYLVKSRQSAVSIGRLMEIGDMPPMVSDSGTRSANGDFEGTVRFERVSFRFPGDSRPVVDGIDLEIPAGKTVAVVGRVGAGKSWLVRMIPRIVDPTEGRITVGGIDLREYPLAELRENIGYVPQDPALFSDTVRENILFGRGEIDDSLVDWAIDVSQLRQDLDAFPRGVDTPIGTRGMSISGGQKQRLSLARALVGRPKVLILDDCTSALDASTEAALWEKLHEVMPGTTSILITHRPDTLQRADLIYVLSEGIVVEQGKHAELIRRKGEYARIYHRYELEAEVN